MFLIKVAPTFMNTFPYGHGHGQGRKTLKICCYLANI